MLYLQHQLPNEIFLMIFEYIEHHTDLLNIKTVSKLFSRIIDRVIKKKTNGFLTKFLQDKMINKRIYNLCFKLNNDGRFILGILIEMEKNLNSKYENEDSSWQEVSQTSRREVRPSKNMFLINYEIKFELIRFENCLVY